MRRRHTRKHHKPDQNFSPPSDSESQEEQEKDIFDEQELPTKRPSKGSKTKQREKKGKPKTKSKSMQMSQDSANSEVVQIREGDESMRQHIRPDFLKRWDGVSNELEITEEEYEGMSPMLEVYWRTKSRNMRAIVFLQFGMMEYFAFENDAITLSEMGKKRLKKFSKYLMVNFWYKQIEETKRQLFDKRIPVLIMNEIEDPEYRAVHGIIKREISEVITPALHPSMHTNTAGRERLLLALYKEADAFGIVLLDGQTNQVYTEEIPEDKYLHETRRVINRYRPAEVVLPHRGHTQIATMTRQICDPHIVQLRLDETKDMGELLQEMINENRCAYLLKLRQKYQKQPKGARFSKYRTVLALCLVRQYLTYLSLKEKVFHHAIFNQTNSDQFRPPFFDSQVYENLELFRVSQSEEQSYGRPGTLLHYLDHCKTQQGRRMIHDWLDCPPSVLQDVLQRQEAVSQLLQQEQALKSHDRLIAFEKLGKRLGDVYHWVERETERGKIILTKSINFEKDYDQAKNPAVQRLRQIVSIVSLLCQYQTFLRDITSQPFKSVLLHKYTHLEEFEDLHKMTEEEISRINGVPALSYVANSVMTELSYDPVSGHLEPSPGQSEVYDENKREFERLQASLSSELAKWSEFFGSSKVQFVSVRAKNEIQVPKSAIKTSGKSHPHPDLIFSSEIAGAVRYVTAETSALSMEQVVCEEAMAQAYEPFLQKVLSKFSSYRYLWDRFVTSSAWVDGLLSLAKASSRMGVRCVPVFREQGVVIRSAVHPSLSEVIQNTVPNDLWLQGQERTLVVTGPNMGGKSTLLKQTCLLAVLAQLGCYVPAKEYVAPVFDQIFCRMGASDRIYQGKSTFYVELEETKRILAKATSRSLVVIDELGRGTSTYDGMAIAQAVLDHLVYAIKPTTLFSTHYTQITQRYANCPEVRLAKMNYEIGQGRLQFTYQLVPGVAQKSFASNVSKMVGIAHSILDKADQKSDQMHHETHRKKLLREACRLAGVLSHPNPTTNHANNITQANSTTQVNNTTLANSKAREDQHRTNPEITGVGGGVGRKRRSTQRQSRQSSK